jgi:spore coat protein CotH
VPGAPPPSPEAEGPCAAVYDPSQLLRYDLQLADADWQALLADTTNSEYFPAEMRCEGGAPMPVALRRKRSGGTTKVGLKVDINRELGGQAFQGLKKLSLESGISEGDSELTARSLLSEYLAWRLMALSGAITGRAAMARVTINSMDLGVYVNVEQVDKTFLASRLGDDSGWLFKKSGNDSGDGYQTNEGQPNPYAANLCFWDGAGCAQPSPDELATLLPQHLDIEQTLRLMAVQALIANTDAFPLKNNNVIFYDWTGGGRLYFPWDLDTTMNRAFDAFTGTVPGGTRRHVDLLFSHWRADYARILADLVSERLTLEVILAELDAILAVAGGALADDPWIGSSADDGEQLRSWWTEQHAAVADSVRAM